MLEPGELVGRLLVGQLEVVLLLGKTDFLGKQIAHQTTQLLRIQLSDVLDDHQIESISETQYTTTCYSEHCFPRHSTRGFRGLQTCTDSEQDISKKYCVLCPNSTHTFSDSASNRNNLSAFCGRKICNSIAEIRLTALIHSHCTPFGLSLAIQCHH